MKKFLALAVALLGLTAAQAINIAWTNRNFGGKAWVSDFANKNTVETPYATVTVGDKGLYVDPTTTKDNYGLTATATTFAYCASYADTSILSVTLVYGSKNTWINTGDLYLVMKNASGETAISSVGTRDTTKGAFCIYGSESEPTYESSGSSLIFNFDKDDTLDLTAGEYSFWLATDPAGETYLGGQDTTNEETLTMGGVVAVEIKAVPEPTVLALLALGVAGVALRRRRA